LRPTIGLRPKLVSWRSWASVTFASVFFAEPLAGMRCSGSAGGAADDDDDDDYDDVADACELGGSWLGGSCVGIAFVSSCTLSASVWASARSSTLSSVVVETSCRRSRPCL